MPPPRKLAGASMVARPFKERLLLRLWGGWRHTLLQAASLARGEQRLALGLSEGILPLPLGPGLCREGIWPWMGWELLGPAQCLPLLLGSRLGRGGAAGA